MLPPVTLCAQDRARVPPGRRHWARLVVASAFVVTVACRPPAAPSPTAVGSAGQAAPSPTAIDRGSVLYAGYCVACHGAHGDGRGPLAATLHVRAADLRSPAVQGATDRELMARIRDGEPLRLTVGPSPADEDLDVAAVTAYLPVMATSDWELLRVGRVVYEGGCAVCHGAYGHSEGVIGPWLGVPDLIEARTRFTDVALGRVSSVGVGRMPPLPEPFAPGEVRALVAYIRHLSDGFRIYDGACAPCHGDDGQGVYSRDMIPPAGIAPPLRPPYAPAKIRHMVRRERGVMPHLRRTLGDEQLADLIAYLRSLPAPAPDS